MFPTVHQCIANDKFGYKYRKQSIDHLQFCPIPCHTLDRTICFLHHLQLHFFKDFFCFLRFDDQGTFSLFSSLERVVTLSLRVTLWPRLFLICFFPTPTAQFSFKTWSTDSLNISLLTLSSNVMTDGKRLRT